MRYYKYSLPGNPIPLARPRFGKGRIFDSQKLLKINHGILLKRQHGKKPLLKSPLCLTVTFFLPFPCNSTRAKKDKIKGTYQCRRPDLDNLIKYVLDTSNLVLFSDDQLVCKINAKKIYDSEPRTEFTLTELK